MNDKRDKLIYDLIFSKYDEFKIDISEYISNIYSYEEFIREIRNILKRSKVKIIKSEVKLDSKTVIWILKVSK